MMTVRIVKWAEVLKNLLLGFFTLESTVASVAVKFAAVTMQQDIFNIGVNACISDNLFSGAHKIAEFCSHTEPPRGC